MKKIRQHKQIKIICISILLSIPILVFLISPNSSFAEISTESYCQLAIKSLKKIVPQTQTLISIVKQYQDDQNLMESLLDEKRNEFDYENESLYFSCGMTAEEFVTYMNRNGKAVNEYLESHPEIKEQIDMLSSELNDLMAEEGALRQAAAEADALPLPATE